MPTCGEVGSDVHAFIKELPIRRVEHRSEIHSHESQNLAEGIEIPRLGSSSLLLNNRHFCFVHVIISAGVARAPDISVCKARCLYTRILPRG